MSQRPLSTDPLTLPVIMEPEMFRQISHYCAQDAPPTLLAWLLDFLRDPFEENEDETYKLNSLWMALAMFLLIALANFLYFNVGSF